MDIFGSGTYLIILFFIIILIYIAIRGMPILKGSLGGWKRTKVPKQKFRRPYYLLVVNTASKKLICIGISKGENLDALQSNYSYSNKLQVMWGLLAGLEIGDQDNYVFFGSPARRGSKWEIVLVESNDEDKVFTMLVSDEFLKNKIFGVGYSECLVNVRSFLASKNYPGKLSNIAFACMPIPRSYFISRILPLWKSKMGE